MNALETITTALGWALVHSIWQITLIGILVGIFLRIFTNLPSSKKHFVVLAGLSVLLLTFLGTFGIHYSPGGQKEAGAAQLLSIHPFPGTVLENGDPSPDLQRQESSLVERVQKYVSANTGTITTIWGVGFLIFLARFTGSALYIHRLRTRYARILENKWQEIAKRIGQSLLIKRTIRILESDLIQVPITTGVLRPVIILPLGLVTHIPFNQLEAVLVHEMAHIKRNDYLLNIVRSMMEAVFFFHPVFWWLSGKLEEYREHACDDLTIARCGSPEPLQKALLDLSSYQPKTVDPAAALFTHSNQLLKRIKRMKTQHNNPKKRGTMAGFMIFPAVVFTLAIASAFAPRNTDLPVLTSSLNPPVEILSEKPPIPSNRIETDLVETKKEPLKSVIAPVVPLPDSSSKTIGVKAKTEDGYILLEFDEEMNLQRITKNGKDLKGEEKEKYQRLADKTKKVFKEEEKMKEHKAELDRLQQQMEEVQKRMQEVQEEYAELWQSYREKSMVEGHFVWPEAYSDVLKDAYVSPPSFNVYPFFEDVPGFSDSLYSTPGYPFFGNDFDPDQFQEQMEHSMKVYEDVIKEHELLREERMQEHLLQEELIRDRAMEHRVLAEKNRLLEKKIRSELIQDDLIDSWEDLDDFELTQEQLEVNGKKTSKKLHQKYLKIFESVMEEPLEGKFEIH